LRQSIRPSFSISVLFLLLPLSAQTSSSKCGLQQQGIDGRHTSPFRYIIHSNKINKQLNNRSVGVLIDKEAFTEDNLRALYELISRRYAKPEWLWIWVSTNLWQLATPEEADGPLKSERGFDPHDDLYPRAFMIRQNGNQLFRYTAQGPPYVNLTKTVILKGKDANP
jgi:hypothetical protein